MTMKRVEESSDQGVTPMLDLADRPDWSAQVKFGPVNDEDLAEAAQLRASSEPWKSRGETPEETLQALSKLRPFIQVGKLGKQVVAYVTIERDGPVPGAAYLRNIVVRNELRRKGLGTVALAHGLRMARDLHRRTVTLRVDPANSPAVSFYRHAGFTTVATVTSKRSGKLRLLMSKEL